MKVNPDLDLGKTFESRSCTDILCWAIFMACVASMCYLSFHAWKEGDKRMYAPVAGVVMRDAAGEDEYLFCGVNNNIDEDRWPIPEDDDRYVQAKDLTGFDKVYLALFALDVSGSRKYGFCVSECPTASMTKEQWVGVPPRNSVCIDSATGYTCEEVFTSTAIGGLYDTEDFMGVYCLPDFDAGTEDWPPAIQAELEAMKAIKDQLLNTSAGSFITDIGDAKVAIGICLGLALLWSLIFIKLLSAFAEQIAWCVIVCV